MMRVEGPGYGRIGSALLGALMVALLAAAPASAETRLYVANAGSDSIGGFSIADDGGLTALNGSPYATAGGPLGVSITPDGKHLYASNSLAGSVSAFSIGNGGALSPVPGSPFAAGGSPAGTAITPDGSHLYVANTGTNNVSVFTVEGDGSLGPVADAPFGVGQNPVGLAVSADGSHLFVSNSGDDNVSSFLLGPTGIGTAVAGSPFPAGVKPRGMAVLPGGGRLYVANSGSNSLSSLTINSDGSLTRGLGSPFEVGNTPNDVAILPDGTHLYVSNTVSDSISAFFIGPTGYVDPEPGSPFGAGDGPNGLAATHETLSDSEGLHLYAANTNSNNISGYELFNHGLLDPIPGSPFDAGGTGPGFQSLAITPDQPPAASFSVGPGNSAGTPVDFDASDSVDPDSSIASYRWDFGDGSSAERSGPKVSHSYDAVGSYTATLTLTDEEGCSKSVIFTGQTAYCNGGPVATAEAQVKITNRDRKVRGAKVSARRKQRQRGKIVVKVKAGAAEQVRGLARGQIGRSRGGVKSARSYKLKKVRKSSAAGKRVNYKLKLKRKKDERKVRKLLRQRGNKLKAKVSVKLTDSAGNSVTKRKKVLLKR